MLPIGRSTAMVRPSNGEPSGKRVPNSVSARSRLHRDRAVAAPSLWTDSGVARARGAGRSGRGRSRGHRPRCGSCLGARCDQYPAGWSPWSTSRRLSADSRRRPCHDARQVATARPSQPHPSAEIWVAGWLRAAISGSSRAASEAGFPANQWWTAGESNP